MMPNKIMKLNSSIPIHIDDTTFANEEYSIRAQEKIKLAHASKTEQKCILGCKRFASLRYVPKNEASREEWRRKLNLIVLGRRDTVCDNHFENGQLMSYSESKEEIEIDFEIKHNRLSQNRSCPTTSTTQLLPPPNTWEYEEPRRKQKCILGCTDGATLHRVPEEANIRMLWRDKLKLKDLKISHRVCANHFSHRNKNRIRSQALPNSPPPIVNDINEEEDDYDEDILTKSDTNYKIDPFAAHEVLLKCKSTVEQQRSLKKRCILGCTDFKTLHNVPRDRDIRNSWIEKLNLQELKVGQRVCNNHFKSTNVKYVRSNAMPDSPLRKEKDDPKEGLKNNTTTNTYESLVADILNDHENENRNDDNNDFDNLVRNVLEDPEVSRTENEINNDNTNDSNDSFIVEMLEDFESETCEPDGNNENNDNSVVETLEEDYEPQTHESEVVNNNGIYSLDMEILSGPESRELETQENGNDSSSCELVEDNDSSSCELLEDDKTEDKIYESFNVEVLENEILDTGNTNLNVQIQETCDVSQFPPSRSNALKSWLQTEDFCITSTKKKS